MKSVFQKDLMKNIEEYLPRFDEVFQSTLKSNVKIINSNQNTLFGEIETNMKAA